MRIGGLAGQLGTTPDAISFYGRRGLLPRPERGENGYREYMHANVNGCACSATWKLTSPPAGHPGRSSRWEKEDRDDHPV